MLALVLFTFLYVCKSCALTAEFEKRIQALEMRCSRTLLNISYKDHVMSEEVCSRIYFLRVAEDREIWVEMYRCRFISGAPTTVKIKGLRRTLKQNVNRLINVKGLLKVKQLVAKGLFNFRLYLGFESSYGVKLYP